MNNKLYPLGSIVKIEEGVLTMIAGYGPVDSETGKVYQYLGIPYPLGILEDSGFVMFNNSKYLELIFSGYQNEESQEVSATISTLITSHQQKTKTYD